MNEVPDQFFEIRGLFHICLLGSSQFKLTNYELSIVEDEDEESDIDVVQNMMENILIDLNIKGFPYVSIVDGGFEACHQLATQLGLEIQNHDSEFCLVCSPSGPSRGIHLKRKFNKFRKSILGRIKNAINPFKPAVADVPPLETELESTTPTEKPEVPAGMITKR